MAEPRSELGSSLPQVQCYFFHTSNATEPSYSREHSKGLGKWKVGPQVPVCNSDSLSCPPSWGEHRGWGWVMSPNMKATWHQSVAFLETRRRMGHGGCVRISDDWERRGQAGWRCPLSSNPLAASGRPFWGQHRTVSCNFPSGDSSLGQTPT